MNGVFAVNKPSGPTSQDIVGTLKHLFSDSPVFEHDVAHMKTKIAQARGPHGKRTRSQRQKKTFIKIGHGGTLDPLADGVLVIGVGSGTKKLQDYLGSCSKTYQAIALFGSATTTYDSEGKILKRTPTGYLTNELVESAMSQFRGDILQTPPVYSALKMDGKRLYEYARSGDALPKEVQPRKCKIDLLEILNGGLVYDHNFSAPTEEASEQEKEFADQLSKISANERTKERGENSAPNSSEDTVDDRNPPILEIKFTVSSGTYIRSLIHDIGIALGTTAHMVKLTRLKQGEWELGKNVFEMDDFKNQSHEVWGAQLKHYLVNGPATLIEDLRERKFDEAIEHKSATIQDLKEPNRVDGGRADDDENKPKPQ
jgi:tRNA pseudouridine55 synthase